MKAKPRAEDRKEVSKRRGCGLLMSRPMATTLARPKKTLNLQKHHKNSISHQKCHGSEGQLQASHSSRVRRFPGDVFQLTQLTQPWLCPWISHPAPCPTLQQHLSEGMGHHWEGRSGAEWYQSHEVVPDKLPCWQHTLYTPSQCFCVREGVSIYF